MEGAEDLNAQALKNSPAAVEVDVVVLRRGQVCRGLVGDREAFGAQGVEGIREIGRCPEHCGVGDEGQAQRLVDLVVEMTSSDVSLVGEEQVAAQRVQAFALVQLAPNAPA